MTETNMLHRVSTEFRALPNSSVSSGHEVRSLKFGGRTVLLGIDAAGAHMVLLPIDSHTPTQRRLSTQLLLVDYQQITIGEASESGRQTTWALRVRCGDSSLNDVFDRLVAQLGDELSTSSSDPEAVLLRALREWKALLAVASRPLDPVQEVGLFGELAVLKRLAEVGGEDVVELWVGPSRRRHDFMSRSADLEVKTTTAGSGSRVVVHGLHQLERIATVPLYLVQVQVVEHPKGESIGDLLEALESLGVDREALTDKLADNGFVAGASADRLRKFHIEMVRAFEVDDEFPGLPSSVVPQVALRGVSNVVFELDLDVATVPLSDQTYADVLGAIADSGSREFD